MIKKLIIVAIILFIGFGIYLTIQPSQVDPEVYQKEIEEFRSERHEFMRSNENSPFQKIPFNGLDYFPPNPAFRVTANIDKITERSYLNIPTTDGKNERYLKYAYANFDLEGQRLRLLILKKTGMGASDILFTAFADDTSGESTYGGGRYLDLSFKNANQITIDFNKAYNPYCAYDPNFVCPLPPKENILPVAIKAGEKNYRESK